MGKYYAQSAIKPIQGNIPFRAMEQERHPNPEKFRLKEF
jgi:hypothetical protein